MDTTSVGGAPTASNETAESGISEARLEEEFARFFGESEVMDLVLEDDD